MIFDHVSLSRLPKKEAELYRQVVNCYETKQYKKGIKVADTILKKFPTNSETLAMKGLLLNHTGNKEGAYDLVKTGIRNDVRSPVCWHVYGLLYRSDNNYKEAIKCYLNALRIEPNKENILRDLSFLQMQVYFNLFYSLIMHVYPLHLDCEIEFELLAQRRFCIFPIMFLRET